MKSVSININFKKKYVKNYIRNHLKYNIFITNVYLLGNGNVYVKTGQITVMLLVFDGQIEHICSVFLYSLKETIMEIESICMERMFYILFTVSEWVITGRVQR